MTAHTLTEKDIDAAVAEFAAYIRGTTRDTPPCEGDETGPCSRAAVWYLECLGCGSPTYACDPHRRVLDKWLAESEPAYEVICLKCRGIAAAPANWMRIR